MREVEALEADNRRLQEENHAQALEIQRIKDEAAKARAKAAQELEQARAEAENARAQAALLNQAIQQAIALENKHMTGAKARRTPLSARRQRNGSTVTEPASGDQQAAILGDFDATTIAAIFDSPRAQQ